MTRRKPEARGSATDKGAADLRAKPCPICGRPSTAAAHPFCSARCSDIDLHRWLGGVYAVPTTALDEDEGESTTRAGADDDQS
jgi:endogenous inhibitor of DNA gyrase (YacG/DUF329 family)